MEDQNPKKETEYEETREMDTSDIEKLSDDCLIEIFQRLTTIADKIRIERVCKRWQNVSERSWNNFKALDFSAKTWGLEVDRYYPRFIKSIDFDKIIRLSGRYLTSISTDVGKFVEICHLLPKLLKLQLIDVCLDDNKRCLDKDSIYFGNRRNVLETTSQCTYDTWQVIRSWLISHGENITNFSMKLSHSHYKEEDFTSLFRKMKQLKSFSLYNCDYLDWRGTFLLELPFEIIQEIIFTSTYTQPFDINSLSTMIPKFKKLQTLGINLERCEEPGILELLSSHAASLKNFKLKLGFTWSRQWQSALLSTLSALTHLEKLDISQCFYVNDEFLEGVAKTCKKLTYLDLHGCFELTDRGISSICNMKKLTYLGIRQLPKIRNPPLEKLTSLVVLVSCWNRNLQEECLCTFLKQANQLQALNVRNCYPVTKNKLLNVAFEVAKLRKSNNMLDLYIDSTRNYVAVLGEKPPFLNVIDFHSNRVPLAKYGIEDLFYIEDPEVHIKSNIV